MKQLKKNMDLIAPPLMVFFILMVIFALKHVYPFGTANVGHFDTYQQYIPLYLHAYDVFHGDAPVFFDWMTAGGSDFSGTFSVYMLNPLNLYFLLFPRGEFARAMNGFFLLKMILISLSMAYYLKKSYHLSSAERTSLSLAYTFSGYAVMYYTNIFFLDSMIMLPLLILSLRKLFRSGQSKDYALLLAFQMATNPYTSIFILFFIVFYSFFYLLLCTDRHEFGKNAARLGVATFSAIALSAFAWLPVVLKWTDSTRILLDPPNSYLSTIKKYSTSDSFIKYGMLSGTEIGVSMLIYRVIQLLKQKKKPSGDLLFSIILMIMLLMPIEIESINLLWHTGSYKAFPMRFGFILSFFAIDCAGKELSRKKDAPLLEIPERSQKIMLNGLIYLIVMLNLHSLSIICQNFWSLGLYSQTDGYLEILSYHAKFVILVILLNLLKTPEFRRKFLIDMTFFQILFMSAGFLAPIDPLSDRRPEWRTMMEEKAFTESIQIGEAFSGERDDISRLKTVSSMLSPNYHLIAQIPGLSQWTHEISGNYFLEMVRAGYDFQYNRNFDTGGTVFSDALFHVTNGLHHNVDQINEKLYSPQQEIGRYILSDCRYQMPFGLLTGESLLNPLDDAYGFAQQNEMYEAISGETQPLITVLEQERFVTDQGKNDDRYYRTLEIPVTGSAVLYAEIKLDLAKIKWDQIEMFQSATPYQFRINGKDVKISYFDKIRDEYPLELRFSILELGSYQNETIHLTISADSESYEELEIGLLDLDRLGSLISHYEDHCASSVEINGTTMRISADCTDEKYLYLPVSYHPNWKAEIDGTEVQIDAVMNGAFMAIPLTAGNHEITLQYEPENFDRGIIISLCGILAILILIQLRAHQKDVTDMKLVQNAAKILFSVLSCGMLIIIYLIPLACYLLRLK